MSRVIRVARQNCKCPVELLGHHQPRQGVGQSHRPEREQQLARVRAASDHPLAGPMAKTMCCAPSSRRAPSQAAKASEVICRPRLSRKTATAGVRPCCRTSQSSSEPPSGRPRRGNVQRQSSVQDRPRSGRRTRPWCCSGADVGQGDLHGQENTLSKAARGFAARLSKTEVLPIYGITA